MPIQRVSDHGLSLGIYIKDPDGNGIEVYYETPREEWHRQDKPVHEWRPSRKATSPDLGKPTSSPTA